MDANKQIYKIVVGIALAVGTLSGCQATLDVSLVPATPTATNDPIRTVGESTLGLTELWRFHTGAINGTISSSPPNLHIADDKVLFSYQIDEEWGNTDDSMLVALAPETGQIIWQTRLEDPRGDTMVDSSYQDGERLYLIYSFRVNAFDLSTGALLWSTSDPKYP